MFRMLSKSEGVKKKLVDGDEITHPVYSPKAVVDRRLCFPLIQETIAQRGAIYKLCQMPCIQQNTVMLTPLLCSIHSY